MCGMRLFRINLFLDAMLQTRSPSVPWNLVFNFWEIKLNVQKENYKLSKEPISQLRSLKSKKGPFIKNPNGKLLNAESTSSLARTMFMVMNMRVTPLFDRGNS